MTIARVLHSLGFRKTKPTRKPGLTTKMKNDRYQFALAHEHWKLEDWKNVIWSDETAVVLGHRRGGYRVWRRPHERYLKSTVRERWKGYKEFMFWGCFSYDKKGPCHIWKPETAQEKKKAQVAIDKLNEELEPQLRTEWELNSGVRRLGLKNKPGQKPQWKWDKNHGKLTREDGVGIDWWRYQANILKPKLIPFALECLKERPKTIVQEDKAPSHSHTYQQTVYNLSNVRRLLWAGNSPDLNMIEPCWPWMKRNTTQKGAPNTREAMEREWLDCWNNRLQQSQIQRWIERIPHHIKEVIRLKGDNNYEESSTRYQRQKLLEALHNQIENQ